MKGRKEGKCKDYIQGRNERKFVRKGRARIVQRERITARKEGREGYGMNRLKKVRGGYELYKGKIGEYGRKDGKEV